MNVVTLNRPVSLIQALAQDFDFFAVACSDVLDFQFDCTFELFFVILLLPDEVLLDPGLEDLSLLFLAESGKLVLEDLLGVFLPVSVVLKSEQALELERLESSNSPSLAAPNSHDFAPYRVFFSCLCFLR